MRRLTLLAAVVAIAACGGKSAPTSIAPLPDDEAVPDGGVAAPAPDATPAPPPAPVVFTVPARTTTVKVIHKGKGKKRALRYALTAGSRHLVDVAQDTVVTMGTPLILPQMQLGYSVDVIDVGSDGTASLHLVLDSVTAVDVPGQAFDAARMQPSLGKLAGVVVDLKVDARGIVGAQEWSVPAEASKQATTIEALLPVFVVLPAEPVAPGATWEVVIDGFQGMKATVTHRFELTAVSDDAVLITGTTRIAGGPQELVDELGITKVDILEGNGTWSIELRGGRPYGAATFERGFVIHGTAPNMTDPIETDTDMKTVVTPRPETP